MVAARLGRPARRSAPEGSSLVVVVLAVLLAVLAGLLVADRAPAARASPVLRAWEPIDFASSAWPTSDRYDRCKSTHRCNRAWARYDVQEANLTFTKQVFRGGLHEPADLFFDFENWKSGAVGWTLNQAFLVGHVNRTGPSHFNSFDFATIGDLYLNHSATLVFNTDDATVEYVDEGPAVLEYTLPRWDPAANASVAPDPNLAASIDGRRYRPAPPTPTRLQGEIATTAAGTEVALFNFDSLFVGPAVLVNLTGNRALAVLSRSSAVWDTPLVATPGTLGGFPGARNVSLDGGVGADANGQGSRSMRVTLLTVVANASHTREVQQFRTSANRGQTIGGHFRLRFKGRVTHPIPARAEPEDVERRIESALVDAGDVRVSRSLLDRSNDGYTWNVTFLSAIGDQPQLEVDGASLTGLGVRIVARTLVDANQLDGNFSLAWRGVATEPISVQATGAELRDALERAWKPHGLAHAHAVRTFPLAGRNSRACVSGSCGRNGPGLAWDATWTVTLATQVGNAFVAWPASPEYLVPDPPSPVSVVAELDPIAPAGLRLLGDDARVFVSLGHDLGLASGLLPHRFANESTAIFTLAFGGAGASHGGAGGLGHARHPPADPVSNELQPDLVGGAGGSMGGEVPQQALPFLAASGAPGSLGFEVAPPSTPFPRGPGLAIPLVQLPGVGGDGGGAIELAAVNDLVIGPNGGVVVDGSEGGDGWRGGGGGAGGSIFLAAGGAITVWAPLSASGGHGGRGTGLGSRGGGGGGGGRVTMLAQSVDVVVDEEWVAETMGSGATGETFGASSSFVDPTAPISSTSSIASTTTGSAPSTTTPSRRAVSEWFSSLHARLDHLVYVDGGQGGLDEENVADENATLARGPAYIDGDNDDDGMGLSRVYSRPLLPRTVRRVRAAPVDPVPDFENPAVRTPGRANGQDGTVRALTAGGARIRVDHVRGGAEDTQRALRVEVDEEVRTNSGVDVPAPYAHNGPFFTLPMNGTGLWWLRRGANASRPSVDPDAPSVVDAAAAAWAGGRPSNALFDDDVSTDAWNALGGAGLDGPVGNTGSRPARVTVYVRLGRFDRGQTRANWGPHIALHEFDARNASAADEQLASGGAVFRAPEGNAAGASGGAGPGGPGAPYGLGTPGDGGAGGGGAGVGGDAEVMVGVGVVEGMWKHGANYRHTPGATLHPRDPAALVVRDVEYDRWYKVDIFLEWSNHTYRVRVDDVTVARDVPFRGDAVRRIGLYQFSAGVAWFDEVYAGPEDTMGFECPVTTADGADLSMARPVQTGWNTSDIGEDSFDWSITRHSSHLSERPMYTHELRAGLLFGDGAPHRRYFSDIATETALGDRNGTHGKVWAGALLYMPGDAPSRDLVEGATTVAGTVLEDGGWTAAREPFVGAHTGVVGMNLPEDGVFDELELAFADGERHPNDRQRERRGGGDYGYGDVDSIDTVDGFGQLHFHGKTGRYYWYGEFDSLYGLGGRVVPRNSTVSPATDGAWATIAILRGGVGGCSTSDLRVWRNEGTMLHFENITDPEFAEWRSVEFGESPQPSDPTVRYRVERPKVVYNNGTDTFVMWQHVDDFPARTKRAAGVATSWWPNGPFLWDATIYPDGNETVDLTIFQDDAGQAFMARTYYETVRYWLPEPIMQPIWESVKDASGATNFALNYHRANYHPLYDNPDDIYLQRWRMENSSWLILIGEWVETYDLATDLFVLSNAGTGEVKRYGAADRDFILEDTVPPHTPRTILGQGHPAIESRFKDPTDPANSVWSPSSVPAVRAQPWANNYLDKNINDNPTHPTVADLLIGPEQNVETRRTKYVAITQLNANYTRPTGTLRILEGELQDGTDLIALVNDFGQFGWEPGTSNVSTYGSDFDGEPEPFKIHTQVDWADRHWQYNLTFNDRAADFRNFRDRQVSPACANIHITALEKLDECRAIWRATLPQPSVPQINYEFFLQSFSEATDTAPYESCLAEFRGLLQDFQDCVDAKVPDYNAFVPWNVGVRECVGGGGLCGPPENGEDPLASYGYVWDAPTGRYIPRTDLP